MKRILVLAAALFLSLGAVAQQTPNLKLNTPPTGTANWGPAINYNFNQIDTIVGGLLHGFQGAWQASAVYSQSQIVTFNGSSYMSLIASNVNQNPGTAIGAWGLLAAASSGGGGSTGPQFHLGGFVGAGSGTSFALGALQYTTDATGADLNNVRNLNVLKAINSTLNLDGYGSISAIMSSTECAAGCDIDIAPTSTTTVSPYNLLTNSGVHIGMRLFGSQADIFNNPALGFNSFKGGRTTQCYFSNQPASGAQVSSCNEIADTLSAPGTYQGSPWQIHGALPINTWVTGRSISQAISIINQCHKVGDCGNIYSYQHPRAGIFAPSDEAALNGSLQTFEDPPMFGTLVTGGPSATIIKGNWTTNPTNAADGLDVDSLDPTDQGAAGLLLTESLDASTGTFKYTTSDSHAVSPGIAKLVTGCGVRGLARNAPQNFQCLVTKVGALPMAFSVGPQPVCFGDNSYTEQVFASAVGTGLAFQGTHAYAVGDQFFDGTNYEEVIVNGTSSAGAPVWPTTLNGEVTDAGGVQYQMVALGSNSTMLTLGLAYQHLASIAVGQGGMCGYGMVQGAGSATPTAIGVWQSIPIVFSEDAHSFNYVAPYAGGQEGSQSRGIPHFPTTGTLGQPSLTFTQISRAGSTVTALANSGTSVVEFNGWIPPANASIVVATGNPAFDAAHTFSNFHVTSVPLAGTNGYQFQLTYTDNLSSTATAGGGTIQVNGLNNYLAPCRAETTAVLGTFPLGPSADSGLPGGDGTLQVEPNHCNWPVGGAVAQPNHFAVGVGGLRVSTNVFTPPFVNLNVGVKLGLTGLGNSGAAFVSMNEEGVDDISTMLGHGGTNTGHWGIHTSDWIQGMIFSGHSPLNGGCFICIGNRPPNDSAVIYPFADLASDTGRTQFLYDETNGNMTYQPAPGSASLGLFGAAVLHAPVNTIDIFLPNSLSPFATFPTTSAYIANTFGYLSFSSAGITDPNSWKSDYTLSAGAYYGASIYAGAGIPYARGIFGGTVGTSQWCYAAVAETPVGHGVSSGNQCTTTGPATLSSSNFLFPKYFQLPGTQTFRIFRTDSPDHVAFPLGTLCDPVQVAVQGCNDIGQAPIDSVDPSTLTDTSGVMYTPTWNQASKTFGASGATHGIGLVPDPGATAGSTRYLTENGTWSVPAGGGGGGGTIPNVTNFLIGGPSNTAVDSGVSAALFARLTGATFTGSVIGPAGSPTACGLCVGSTANGLSGVSGNLSILQAGVTRAVLSSSSLSIGGFLVVGSVTTADTGISRLAAGILGVGTGTAGSVAGSVEALRYMGGIGTTIASSAVIAPTAMVTHITGTTPITTITLPAGMSATMGGCIKLIADGAWTTTATVNIFAAITATVGHAYDACYDGTKWYINQDSTGGGGGGMADPGANGFVFRTGLNVTAAATVVQLQALLASDTVNNTSVGFHTGTGGDATIAPPLAGADYFAMKGGALNYSHNGAAYVPFVNGSAALILQHGGVNNGSQTTLNLLAGTNMGIVDNGTGTLTLNATGGSSGPNFNVPRDLNPHYEIAAAASGAFNTVSAFNGNSLGTTTWNVSPDAAGYTSGIITTGATINTPVGQSLNTAILGATNPSFKAIFHLASAAAVNTWVGLCSYCQTNLANTAGDVGAGNVAFVGFRHSASIEATNWTCYASDSTSGAAGTTMDSTVAVDTAKMQVFDVIYVSGAPQFYINGTRVCSSFSATHLPGATVALGAVAVWQNTTTTPVIGDLFELYFGAN